MHKTQMKGYIQSDSDKTLSPKRSDRLLNRKTLCSAQLAPIQIDQSIEHPSIGSNMVAKHGVETLEEKSRWILVDPLQGSIILP